MRATLLCLGLLFSLVNLKILYSKVFLLKTFQNYPESSFAFWHSIWNAFAYVFYLPQIFKRIFLNANALLAAVSLRPQKQHLNFHFCFCSLKLIFSIFLAWISCIRNFRFLILVRRHMFSDLGNNLTMYVLEF